VVIGLGGGRQALAGIGVAGRLRVGVGGARGRRGPRIALSVGLDPAAPRARVPRGVAVVQPQAFRRALAGAMVAVVAGGMTLYEACACGTPVVAVPVVPGQRTAVRRFVRAGLAAGVPASQARVGSGHWSEAVAAAVVDLLGDTDRRTRLARRGPRTIDGRGAARVADAIAALVAGRATRMTRTE
jgi:UDP:flavonoid glycosyltransferase YjiC (YdhE family)